jgi:site-specific recombinase XerD
MPFDSRRYPFIERDDLGHQWIRLRERLGAPETTLRAYASDLNDYLRWCSSDHRAPYPLSLDGIADYVRDLRGRTARRGQRRSFGRRVGLEPTTVYRRITTLRLWFDYLVDVDAIGKSAFVRESSRFSRRIGLIRKPINTPWIPNDRDWQIIIDLVATESRRNRLMFLLTYECALRRAELCSLSLSDVDHAQRQVAIRAAKSKSRFDRRLPISKETGAMLIAYERSLPMTMSSTEPIFRSESHRNFGHAISPWAWNKVVERIRDKGALPRFHPHTIRHVALTDLARAGWDVLELKSFAGHRKISTTELYVHLGGRHLAEAMDRTLTSIFAGRRRSLIGIARP